MTASYQRQGRLSVWAAAFVVARRDVGAIITSRSFLFFLLGPLFPLLVGAMAGTIGAHADQAATPPQLGIMLPAPQADQMVLAHAVLGGQLGDSLPPLMVLRPEAAQTPAAALQQGQAGANLAAVLSGTLDHPVLTGTKGSVTRWRGAVSLLVAQAKGVGPAYFPKVDLAFTATSTAREKQSRQITAQIAQTVLFMLTMMLAGMVLSNLVEEKSNKIIEVLAAALPMEAVFLGKLFAMLAVSLLGIGVWSLCGTVGMVALGHAMPSLPVPALGWPAFIGLAVVYFAMGYLVLGSVFLALGALANTVREVQTISMPVTMSQVLVFFLASYAMTQPGGRVEWAAMVLPFSSPYAMLARAALNGQVWPHVLALAWQGLWVVVFIRLGARMFRRRVMQSGPVQAGPVQATAPRRWWRKG